jgi:ADP-heptose:LPS heptosyltransferase
MDHSIKLKNVKKIAVLKAGALGDFIVTLPSFHALQRAYPEAEIVLLGNPWHQKFLIRGRTPINRVVVVPFKKGIRAEAGLEEDGNQLYAFFKEMQQEQFDIAISFNGNGISANPFIKQLGAKLTVGTSCAESEKIDRSLNYYYYQPEVVRYLEIVRLVGAATDAIEPQLHIMEEDTMEVKNLGLYPADTPYILLNPVANDLRRMWPLDNYIRLGDSFRKKKIKMIFTGSTADRGLVDAIISKMTHSAINACGISIGGLSALASRASLMISPDTGPLHIAQAVQCPTVGIYWAPNVINWAALSRQIHRPVISWKMECPHCGVIPNNPYPFEPLTGCRHEVSFVRDITIEEVEKAAVDLLTVKNQLNKGSIQKDLMYN